MHEYEESAIMTKIAQSLKRSLGLESKPIKFSAEDLMTVQSACAFDIALYNQKHTWCSLMSKEFIRSLEYLDDLQQFYWIGGGYKINYEMAATLLREIFDIMRGREAQNNTLAGIFYFAHAETTLPLMTLMGYGDRSFLAANATQADIASRGFRTSVLSPFAANIETRLFRRKTNRGELYVQILVNEKEAKIPGCDRLFCKLSQLEKQWRYYLTSYDFHRDCE
ncbi:PHOsphatase [Phytophthora boehmeriae]|uniref:PHOsphatase n=1 Tax=Phytophthora boehmeriae TaxID=109152 RepID=A0A8T1X442_9STRA|nr:PHOsphatase [Phytophthora boehmeriae]